MESSLFRGILRSTMTVLGGTLGYLLMLNGTLANNPYWVCAFVAAGSGLAGLLAPDRTLRCAVSFLACMLRLNCLLPAAEAECWL